MRGFRDSSSVAKGVDFRDSTSVAKETRYVVLCALLSLRGIFVKKGSDVWFFYWTKRSLPFVIFFGFVPHVRD